MAISAARTIGKDGGPALACPLCGLVSRRKAVLPHTGLQRCVGAGCGLLFAFPQLNDVALDAAYRKHYYPDDRRGMAEYENTPCEILDQTFGKLETEKGPLAGKTLLDFGCGVGRLCEVALRHGMQVTGIEPDPNARRTATGVRVWQSIESLRAGLPGTKFNFVAMWDVIEHLREPWTDLQALGSILEANGWLLLSTPNAASFRAHMLRTRWENMVNPTHFYYFTRTSLAATLRKSGFQGIYELDVGIRYPAHGIFQRIFQRLIRTARLQGQLIYLAKQGPKNLCEADGCSATSPDLVRQCPK
jgi:2-polyprenyl-3-methyl-5-hydroxy-6-metoxy-1,4-benzoquinol methylase